MPGNDFENILNDINILKEILQNLEVGLKDSSGKYMYLDDGFHYIPEQVATPSRKRKRTE